MHRTFFNALIIAAGVVAIGAAPVLAADPLKVGVIFTFSGTGPPIGKSLDAAIAAYQAQHGDTAGGRKITFVRRDDGGAAPELAKRLAQQLIVDEHVDLLYGLMFTPNAMAVGAISTQAKKPVFVTNAATSGILAQSPYMVRFSFTEAQLCAPLGEWAAKNKIKTAYAVYLDYGPGIEANTAFAKSFAANGGTMLGSTAVPMMTGDYSAYIQRIKDAKPDAVFAFVGAANGGRGFVKAFADGGLAASGIRLLSTNDLVLESNLPSLGDAAIGIISASNYSATLDTRENIPFVKAFQKAYGDATLPDFSAVAAYDAVGAIYRILDAQHGAFDPDRALEQLKGMKMISPRGPITIDPQTRDIVQNIYIMRTEKRNGVYVNVRFATYPMVRDPLES